MGQIRCTAGILPAPETRQKHAGRLRYLYCYYPRNRVSSMAERSISQFRPARSSTSRLVLGFHRAKTLSPILKGNAPTLNQLLSRHTLPVASCTTAGSPNGRGGWPSSATNGRAYGVMGVRCTMFAVATPRRATTLVAMEFWRVIVRSSPGISLANGIDTSGRPFSSMVMCACGLTVTGRTAMPSYGS